MTALLRQILTAEQTRLNRLQHAIKQRDEDLAGLYALAAESRAEIAKITKLIEEKTEDTRH